MSLRNTVGRQGNIVEIRAPGLKGDAGASWRGDWSSSYGNYSVNDIIRYSVNGNLYICLTQHLASSSTTPTLFSVVDPTPTIAEGNLNGVWQTDQAQTSDFTVATSSVGDAGHTGSGEGLKVKIATDSAGNPTITLPSDAGNGTSGRGKSYADGDTFRVIDPGSTSEYATLTVSSNWSLFAAIEDAENWANSDRHTKFTDNSGSTQGYSAKHGALQALDWASKTTGFVPKDTRSENDSGDPDITSNEITFTQPHGYSNTNEIRFRVIANSKRSVPAMPTGLSDSVVYYVITPSTSTKMTLSTVSGGSPITISGGTGTLIAQDDFSAKAWAVGGTDVTTTATRGSAKDWATKDDGAVDTVEHSAKAWAIGGIGITTTTDHGSAKDWATKANGGVDGGTAVNSYSALAWAVGGTGIDATEDRGSSKDWATKVSARVDDPSSGDYSAKEYAIGTTVSTGSAREWAQTVDAAIDTTYSAKEYAQGDANSGALSTGGSAKSWAQDIPASGTDDVDGASTNDRSAKAWAQGANMTGATLGGSAKDWASQESGTVDGTLYSAKYHANAASASATTAAAAAVAMAIALG